MKRRDFIGAAAAVSAALPVQLRSGISRDAPTGQPAKEQRSIGGVPFAAVKSDFKRDLDEYVGFFLAHGIDFERGGFTCSLDHDGTLVDTNKFHWFQGRGVWVLSHLHLHFDKNPRYLEAARKTCDFMLRYFPQDKEKMRWATIVARDGAVVQGYENDPFGCYFGIEGHVRAGRRDGRREAVRHRARPLPPSLPVRPRPRARLHDQPAGDAGLQHGDGRPRDRHPGPSPPGHPRSPEDRRRLYRGHHGPLSTTPRSSCSTSSWTRT